MMVPMWRAGQGGIYLEPGEVSILAGLALEAVPYGPPSHPRDLLLAALAAVLEEIGEDGGVILAPAPPSVRREAAAAHVCAPEPPTREQALIT